MAIDDDDLHYSIDEDTRSWEVNVFLLLDLDWRVIFWENKDDVMRAINKAKKDYFSRTHDGNGMNRVGKPHMGYDARSGPSIYQQCLKVARTPTAAIMITEIASRFEKEFSNKPNVWRLKPNPASPFGQTKLYFTKKELLDIEEKVKSIKRPKNLDVSAMIDWYESDTAEPYVPEAKPQSKHQHKSGRTRKQRTKTKKGGPKTKKVRSNKPRRCKTGAVTSKANDRFQMEDITLYHTVARSRHAEEEDLSVYKAYYPDFDVKLRVIPDVEDNPRKPYYVWVMCPAGSVVFLRPKGDLSGKLKKAFSRDSSQQSLISFDAKRYVIAICLHAEGTRLADWWKKGGKDDVPIKSKEVPEHVFQDLAQLGRVPEPEPEPAGSAESPPSSSSTSSLQLVIGFDKYSSVFDVGEYDVVHESTHPHVYYINEFYKGCHHEKVESSPTDTPPDIVCYYADAGAVVYLLPRSTIMGLAEEENSGKSIEVPEPAETRHAPSRGKRFLVSYDANDYMIAERLAIPGSHLERMWQKRKKFAKEDLIPTYPTTIHYYMDLKNHGYDLRG